MGFVIATRLKTAIAFAAWCVGLLWLGILVSGGGRSIKQYSSSHIVSGTEIFANSINEIWSGWWSPTDGYRLATSLRPDLVFGWVGRPRSDCAATLSAFLPDPIKGHDQQLVWRLNSGDWHGPVVVSGDAQLVLAPLGTIVKGTNILTFRLPDARVATAPDTRLLSIALRSLRIDCLNVK